MKFIPYDDAESIYFFGMPITAAETWDDDDRGPALDELFQPYEAIDDAFRWGVFNEELYDITQFTQEHITLAIQIGEQLTEQLFRTRRPSCRYCVLYNECYVVVTRNRSSWCKGKNWPDDKKMKHIIIESPVIMFEILPPGATKKIRTNEFDCHRYHRCTTLEVVLWVSQDEPYVEMYRKANDWKQECISVNQFIRIDLLKLELSLASIYKGVLHE